MTEKDPNGENSQISSPRFTNSNISPKTDSNKNTLNWVSFIYK